MAFFCGSVYFGQQVKKTIFFQSRSLAEPLATFRGTPVEKPWFKVLDEVVHNLYTLIE
jgi:hypothetical protein